MSGVSHESAFSACSASSIGWLALPEAAEREIIDIIEPWEEERTVVYVTHMERMAFERGREEGLRMERLAIERRREVEREEGRRAGCEEGRRVEAKRLIQRVLARRFGVVAALDDQIAGMTDLAKLEALLDQAIIVTGLEEMSPLLDNTQG
jgi:hypothetical protein